MGEIAVDVAIRGAVAKATLDHFEYAAVVCDEAGEVVVGNDAAHDLFEQRDGLALRDGRVQVAAPGPRERFHALLAGSDTAAGTEPSAPRTEALLVPRPSRLPAYQIVLREIDRHSVAFAHGSQRLWSLIISDPARSPRVTRRTRLPSLPA